MRDKPYISVEEFLSHVGKVLFTETVLMRGEDPTQKFLLANEETRQEGLDRLRELSPYMMRYSKRVRAGME
jgi:hypothetical protein